jgi:hypothetical protein
VKRTYREVHPNCRNARESVNILRQELCCVSRNISAGAKPAQKLKVTISQTSHEIRPVQLQVKSGL